MKRITRRTIGLMLGLTLGWIAAGYIPASFDAATLAHVGHPHDGDADHKHPVTSANQLVPEHGDAPFHHSVIVLIGGLFIGACVIGLGLRALGENDPGVVATEQDLAEAEHFHAHDAPDEESHGDAHGDVAGKSHGHGH